MRGTRVVSREEEPQVCVCVYIISLYTDAGTWGIETRKRREAYESRCSNILLQRVYPTCSSYQSKPLALLFLTLPQPHT